MINTLHPSSHTRTTEASPKAEALRMAPAPGTPDRVVIRVTVTDHKMFPAAELFHDLAAAQGIDNASVSIDAPHFAQYTTPPQKVWPVSIRFYPDRPNDAFSPALLEKVNGFGQQIENRLRQASIENVGPVA
ncbi:hypothetical protein ICY20_27700 [Pseudomonas sp. P115]|uniref:hypothetical protein n=1 Tax=Pseudomonas pisciculturae TaxID=2730413 RepID=UPI001892374E|nr:hypothetical protein [Pseudomonas pisciculturae]MBF6031548.1 hypothetical protein [Pseudomonas pisciculturae]